MPPSQGGTGESPVLNMSTGYKVKDILRISVPILIEDVLRTLMGTVNTFTLSRVSDSASAAVGVTNQILNVVLLVSVMMSAGVGIIENQAIGAGDEREGSRIMMNSLTLAAIFGVVCSSLTVIFSDGLVSFSFTRQFCRVFYVLNLVHPAC